MVASAAGEAFAADLLQCPNDGAVIEHRRRCQRLQLQVNWHGVALVGPDPRTGVVEGEPLLVRRTHDLVELRSRHHGPAARQR